MSYTKIDMIYAIESHFRKQGKAMTNLKKATKEQLMSVINKNEINVEMYSQDRKNELKQQRQQEEEQRALQEQKNKEQQEQYMLKINKIKELKNDKYVKLLEPQIDLKLQLMADIHNKFNADKILKARQEDEKQTDELIQISIKQNPKARIEKIDYNEFKINGHTMIINSLFDFERLKDEYDEAIYKLYKYEILEHIIKKFKMKIRRIKVIIIDEVIDE